MLQIVLALENDTCHFFTDEAIKRLGNTAETGARPHRPRVGRPRRGTETERVDAMIAAATRVFLREGYGAASIDKVAHEAGVSTRTIYERFKNKADLLAAVITRLVDRDMATLFGGGARTPANRGRRCSPSARPSPAAPAHPEAAALFRIVATEAQRFPALAAKMRDEHQGAREQCHRPLFSRAKCAAAGWCSRTLTERRPVHADGLRGAARMPAVRIGRGNGETRFRPRTCIMWSIFS